MENLLKKVPRNGILSVISRGPDSNGDLLAFRLLKELVSGGERVFVVLYEPLLAFSAGLRSVGLELEELLGENFMVFDAFGSFKNIPRDKPYIYQLRGYLDDGVFVAKYGEFVRNLASSLDGLERVWLFTYLSSGACKLFSNPRKTYKLIWSTKMNVRGIIPDMRSILLYESLDCPEIEEFIYLYSDIVIEALREGRERRLIITKEPRGGENG